MIKSKCCFVLLGITILAGCGPSGNKCPASVIAELKKLDEDSREVAKMPKNGKEELTAMVDAMKSIADRCSTLVEANKKHHGCILENGQRWDSSGDAANCREIDQKVQQLKSLMQLLP